MAHNLDVLAHRQDVKAWSPLLHPEFVNAVSRDGGRLGVGDRTTALRALIPDLLPDAVLARTTKAIFNEAYNARHTIEFAESWSGDGLDEEMVDPAELRRIWLSGRGNALTAALLQTAWLADHARNNGVG
jgi:asparagine synthase (glutamine-hydrolysing)